MSAPRTRRRRRTTVASRFGVLVLALVGVAGVMYMALRLMAGPGGESAVQATPIPTAAPATAVPTASPEPTPSLPTVDINSWELRMIRYENPLGKDFVPESLTTIENNERMDSRVAPAMEQLIASARSAGYSVYFCSGYRDYNTQYTIWWNHIYDYEARGYTRQEAEDATRLAVNYPGCSEHQSGLCADVLESWDQPMEPYIGGSGLMLWLEQNCAKYGFVVRYPDGKTDITGVEYEPWHLRYVGWEAAQYMMENGLCLEEFLDLYSVG